MFVRRDRWSRTPRLRKILGRRDPRRYSTLVESPVPGIPLQLSSLTVVSAKGDAGEKTAAVERRPTPLDPYPEPRPPPVTADEAPQPTELGPDAIALLEG